MSKVLDTIEVEIEVETPDGIDVQTLGVEITDWPTRATLEHPGDLAEWRLSPEPGVTLWEQLERLEKLGATEDAINDQVQEYCAERERPRGEG